MHGQGGGAGLRREIGWRMLDAPGEERLVLAVDGVAAVAEGRVEADLGEGRFTLDYRIVCDEGFRFAEAQLHLSGPGGERRLAIAREPGGWLVDGLGRPDLDGCAEIDIMVTPFTNTLPLRTLHFVPGQARRIRVAYVSVPDLSVTVQEQDYTQLGATTRPGRFRFHSVDSGFVAELGVDEDGLVLDYGSLWQRL
jgi:uncharacterized protein